MIKKHYGSVFNNEQELLTAIQEIHGKIELDPMYFKGGFYRGINKPKLLFDICPQTSDTQKADARSLPLQDGSINCMILDPPFMIATRKSQREYYSSRTHSFYNSFDELYVCYEDLLKEAKRVLRKGGILFFKCQDYTDSRTIIIHSTVYLLATKMGFYAKDLAILWLPKNKVSNNALIQRHLRKTHTYFWVFRKE